MLVRLVSNCWSCDLPTSASQSIGITGMSHCTLGALVWTIGENMKARTVGSENSLGNQGIDRLQDHLYRLRTLENRELWKWHWSRGMQQNVDLELVW